MLRHVKQRVVIGLVSVGLLSGGWVKASWGQTCANNFVCTANPNTATATASTVSGGGNNHATASFATVGGGGGNTASGDSATVGGGFENTASQGAATVGGGFENTASGNRTTVGGGQGNTAGGSWTTVGGGIDNATSGNASTVGGGASNEASADRATVGGGENNMASGDRSTVGGGYGNRASGSHAAVGGGRINAATAIFAIVTGGYANAATGVLSWAGGRRAKARHRGAYVWADATNANFASTAPNQYNVRAAGGVRIFSNVAATVGVRLLPGSNAWSIASDRALKEDFRDVDKQQVLEGVQQLTIQEWKLKEQEGNIRHIGPIAQEFRAAFGVGSDERLINSGDAIGVALVAIQALAERVEGLVAQNTALQAHVQELQTQLEAQASSARKAEEGGVLRAAYGGFRVHEE